ncbi:PIR Superfamily Protein [Plasmodium ovale curtisi]|uniref:PIR Superfamily Protein n=1 Tax=Plasmodium ovale curtisi TaxID=864141 RepID=A0A1A8WHU2_PLAOA|nr:PIR Superfamily Protein [Plasmodium ovale curtisi]SBT00617.1 PIR Superfamily Protein [Plasmodium ovale curtisi]
MNMKNFLVNMIDLLIHFDVMNRLNYQIFNPIDQFILNKTKILKNMWISVNRGKELLNFYDIENGNSDLVEYNIGYSSASNSYSFYIHGEKYY